VRPARCLLAKCYFGFDLVVRMRTQRLVPQIVSGRLAGIMATSGPLRRSGAGLPKLRAVYWWCARIFSACSVRLGLNATGTFKATLGQPTQEASDGGRPAHTRADTGPVPRYRLLPRGDGAGSRRISAKTCPCVVPGTAGRNLSATTQARSVNTESRPMVFALASRAESARRRRR